MTSELPLEVLGLVAPFLSWVEGLEGVRLPETWLRQDLDTEQRVLSWLNRELPTYSRDNLDEIWWLARSSPSVQEGRPSRERRLAHVRGPRRLRARLDPPPHYSLRIAFDRLSDRYLLWSGNELCIQGGRVEELHELALRFPVGHLIRHRHARAVATGILHPEEALLLPDQMSRLHTNSQGIRAVVERGLTEGHLHLWGVLGAEEGWADHLLATPAAGELEEFGDDERRLLILSRLAVRLLSLGLLHAALGLEGDDLPFDLIPLFDRLYTCRPREEGFHRSRLRHRLAEAVTETPTPRRERSQVAASDLEWILELIEPSVHLLHYGRRPRPGRGPDAELVGIRRRMRRIQRFHFAVHRLIIELDADGPGAVESPLWRYLHDLFYRYLVLHTHHWHLAVQSGKTTGLRQFRRYYGARQRVPFVSDLEAQGLVVERLRRSPDLKVVEGRVSTPASPAELVPWILGYAEAVEHREIESFGLVVHFLKGARGEVEALAEGEEGERIEPLPPVPPVGPAERGEAPAGSANTRRRTSLGRDALRHGRIRRQTRHRAFQLYQLLCQPHPAVPFIVGIDAANLELTTPPEVFAPSFRFLREYPIPLRRSALSDQSFSTYGEIADLVRNRNLGMTFHVGEDFRHLLSGLRAIDEVVSFLEPRPGDRLGHAIALALDPEVWASQLGYQAVVPQQEALDTLVWLYHLLGPGHELLGELRVEEWIQQLSRLVYGPGLLNPVLRRAPADGSRGAGDPGQEPPPRPRPAQVDLSPRVLFDAMRLRQLDPLSLDADRLARGDYRSRVQISGDGVPQRRWHRVQEDVHGQVNEQIGSDDAYRVLWMYWYDPSVRRAGGRIVPIDMERKRKTWLQLCHEVQGRMRALIERQQLVIEVNPSSNRIVGAMPRLGEHHVFRLTLDAEQRPVKEIRVTINTDDPGVFNTSLAHEYYLLAEILHDRGVPEPRIVDWLEWLRRNGNDYSFVRTLPGLDDPRVRRLLKELKKTHPTYRHRLAGQVRRPGLLDRERVEDSREGRGAGGAGPRGPGSAG